MVQLWAVGAVCCGPCGDRAIAVLTESRIITGMSVKAGQAGRC